MSRKKIGILEGREWGGRKEGKWKGRKGKCRNPFSGVIRENFMEEVGPVGG